MCALSSLCRPNLGLPSSLDAHISREQQRYYFREAEGSRTSESLFHFPPASPQDPRFNRCASFTETNNHSGDQSMVKKLCHNASERDRRKKLNTLYSSLRSLLPVSDQSKKLSIPATVSRVLKYLPELQQEVERLYQKKEEVLKRITKRASGSAHQEKQKESVRSSLLPGILATQLSETEIAIQISTMQKTALSDVLRTLEEFGLLLLSASSFSSSNKSIFYNMHLQMDGSCQVNCEDLSKRLLLLYETKKELLP